MYRSYIDRLITMAMVKTRSSAVEKNSTNAQYPSSRATRGVKGAEKNVKKRMTEEPVDIKQPHPKRIAGRLSRLPITRNTNTRKRS